MNEPDSVTTEAIVDLLWELTDDSEENAQTGEVTMTLTKKQNERLYSLFWRLGGKYRRGLTACGWTPAKHERRVVGHTSGWQEQLDTCVCGKPWPCQSPMDDWVQEQIALRQL